MMLVRRVGKVEQCHVNHCESPVQFEQAFVIEMDADNQSLWRCREARTSLFKRFEGLETLLNNYRGSVKLV